MQTLKVATIQMTSTMNLDENITNAINLIRQASIAGAKLVVLPEWFVRIGNNTTNTIVEIAEEIGVGKIQQQLAKTAKECNIYLVAGTIPIKSKIANKCFNTTIVYDNYGDIICYYNKIHLFKLDHPSEKFDESLSFEHGSDIVTFNIENFSFGLSVCYDIRFPELFREMLGIDAIILPAAFTHYTGQAHWEILLRARAIENQCYVVAAAQTGIHQNGRQTYGNSMIIDPWGTIKSTLPDGEGFIVAEIDKTVIEKIRAELPALQNRRI